MNRDSRACLLAALATLMTMASLSPLLADRSWLAPVTLVVASVGLAGAAVAALGLPRWLVLPVPLVVGYSIATALLVPSQARLGGFLPTGESTGALVVLVRSGLATSQAVLAPAVVDAGITTLLTLAAGAVAVITLLIAGPLRRPGAAGLPLLLVVCVASTLAPGGIGVLGYLSAALGYLALALTDGDQRVRAWGAVLGRRAPSGVVNGAGVTQRLTAMAATTAALAIGVGAVLPAFTPGGDRLTDLVDERFSGGAGAEGLTTVNPFLDIRDDLGSQDDTVLVRYSTTAEDPDPLRIVTADSFDGAVWVPSETTLPRSQDVAAGLPAPPGASAEVLSAAPQVSTAIGVGPLAQTYLPLPYPAAVVDVAGRWLYDPRTLNVVTTEGTTQGLTYSVTSYDIRPDAAALASAPPDGLDPLWTDLPPDMSVVVADEAARVVAAADAGTRYEEALALQQWFRSDGGFIYSLDAPDTTDRDAVEAFLIDRRGYCVQFASTMALMARSLGIPARVAVGFLPGEQVEAGQWEIRADDAHAWPELYFEGVGWVRFEPTPSTRTGGAPEWAVPDVDAPAPVPSPVPSQQFPRPQEGDAAQGAGQDDEGAVAGVLRQVVDGLGRAVPVLMALLLTAGLLTLPRTWRWWRDRRRVSAAAGNDAATAVLAWTLLLERLADLGALPAGVTVREQVRDLIAQEVLDTSASAALLRLAGAAERALFADEPAPAAGLLDDAETVRAEVASSRIRAQRMRARWLPPPTPDIIGPGIDRAGERVG